MPILDFYMDAGDCIDFSSRRFRRIRMQTWQVRLDKTFD